MAKTNYLWSNEKIAQNFLPVDVPFAKRMRDEYEKSLKQLLAHLRDEVTQLEIERIKAERLLSKWSREE